MILNIWELSKKHFYNKTNSDVFDCMYNLYTNRKEINIINLIDKLPQFHDYIMEIWLDISSGSQITEYSNDIIKYYSHRQAIELAGKITANAYDNSTDWILQYTQKIIEVISNTEVSEKDFTQSMIETLDTIWQEELECICSWWIPFLQTLYWKGIMPWVLNCVSARPWVWKSTLAVDILREVANQDVWVSYFSLEMTVKELQKKVASYITQKPFWEWKDFVNEVVNKWDKFKNIDIIDNIFDVNRIINKIRYLNKVKWRKVISIQNRNW